MPITLDSDRAGTSGSHPRSTALHVLAAPSTSPAVPFNSIEPGLFTVACWRMDDTRFDFDSSFVRPAAKSEIALLHEISDQHKGRPLSVFGHADPTGGDDYNKGLSGRRAMAIYGLLVRDATLWERLYSQPFGGDAWGASQIATMLGAVPSASGDPYAVAAPGPGASSVNAIRLFQTERGLTVDGIAGPDTRKALFRAYMNFLCGDSFTLTPADFLGGGADGGGKGDYQGCSEFNPVLVFSQSENATLPQTQRDNDNSSNRRVVIFFFQDGTRVDDKSWPCPRVSEGTAACRKRFWSDGEKRRAPQDTRRKYEETHDTFACRFYDRMAIRSPCEATVEMVSFFVRLCDFDRQPMKSAPFRILQGTAIHAGVSEPDGWVFIQALRRPDQLTIEWTFAGASDEDGYPFHRDYFVDLGDDSDIADERRLINLGYVATKLEDKVRAWQRDFGEKRTGQLADIRDELRTFHDGGVRPGSAA